MTLHPETTPTWFQPENDDLRDAIENDDLSTAVSLSHIAWNARRAAEKSGIGYRQASERYDATAEAVGEIMAQRLITAIEDM